MANLNFTFPTQLIKPLIVALLLLFLATSAIKIVDAGTVGVVKRFGKVTGNTLNPGFHLVAPIIDSVVTLPTKKVTYETAPDTKRDQSDADYKDYPVDTNTQDGQPVDISYTIRFAVDPTQAGWIVQNIGTESNLVEKIVKAESRVWARNIPRNYRAETITQKPSFRTAFASRRCLIPNSGFYEWHRTPEGKTPYYIKIKSERLASFAGLYDTWTDAEGKLTLETFTIITTASNSLIAPIHDRMPVFIAPKDEDTWLTKSTATKDLLALLQPYPERDMEAYPVSKEVNSTRNNSPDLLNPIKQ